MREKIVPSIFLMLVLLIGFPSSTVGFNAFADDDDNDNLKVSAEESKAYQKQKEKAEKAREKAEERKDKLKEKYDREIKKLEEKAKNLQDKQKAKYEDELKKLEEKAQRLKETDYDDDVYEFGSSVDAQLSSVTGTGVTICHYPPGNPDNAKTKTVGLPAAKAHMKAHGDTMGPCDPENLDLVLEELEAKFAKKYAKLEAKRAELQQKFIDKAQKLADKFEEKQNKRAQKLLEKVQSGQYFDEFIEDEGTLRKFELSFDPINAQPINPSGAEPFSATITLVTSSSTDSKGTMKFKVEGCEIGEYKCEYGKARTTSSGPGGAKNGLVIIATLDDGNGGSVPGLKAFVTADEELRPLVEGDGPIPITMHSPQSKIIHQWFLGGEGSLTISNISPEISSLTDYEDYEIHDDVDYEEHEPDNEIELEGEVDAINLDSQFFTLLGSVFEIFVNEDTEFDEGFEGLEDLAPGFHVDVDIILSNGSHVATEIEVEEELDDDDLDGDDEDDDEEDDEEEDD